MKHLQKEVCDELIHSLHEWGVNRPEEHSAFRQRVVRDCVASLSQQDTELVHYKELKNKRFPKNYYDAFEHILRHEDVASDNIYVHIDGLDLGSGAYPEPYHRLRDRITGKVIFAPGDKNGYRLKKDFQVYTSEQLNPLSRFQFEMVTKEELFYERWFVEDKASRDGLMFEAVLTCYSLAFEACYSCKYRKALRWNGGGKTSWQDLICSNCGMYCLSDF